MDKTVIVILAFTLICTIAEIVMLAIYITLLQNDIRDRLYSQEARYINSLNDISKALLRISSIQINEIDMWREFISDSDKNFEDIINVMKSQSELVEQRFSQVYEEHRYCRDRLTQIQNDIWSMMNKKDDIKYHDGVPFDSIVE